MKRYKNIKENERKYIKSSVNGKLEGSNDYNEAYVKAIEKAESLETHKELKKINSLAFSLMYYMENLKDLKKKLEKVEKELSKVRGKEYEQPFGSMKRAKISRKWDELAKTKSILQTLIYDLEKCEKCRSFDTENCHSINCPKR